MLVHIIDGSSPDPVGDFNAIQTELELFAEDLASKPQASTDMHHMMREAWRHQLQLQAMHLVIDHADARDLEASCQAESVHLVIDV